MLVIQQPERQADNTWLVHWQDNQNKINHAYYRDLENALNKIIILNKMNLSQIENAKLSKKSKCLKCLKPRNHAGKSSNIFYCNTCRIIKNN